MKYALLSSFPNNWTSENYFQRQMLQWITALERSASSSTYTGRNRFDSFAPIRLNVAAQWLVDGVSFTLFQWFWTILTSPSETTSGTCLALYCSPRTWYIFMTGGYPQVEFFASATFQPLIYLELLLRRPGKERYRLDRLLERKAKEGVKIYVIL